MALYSRLIFIWSIIFCALAQAAEPAAPAYTMANYRELFLKVCLKQGQSMAACLRTFDQKAHDCSQIVGFVEQMGQQYIKYRLMDAYEEDQEKMRDAIRYEQVQRHRLFPSLLLPERAPEPMPELTNLADLQAKLEADLARDIKELKNWCQKIEHNS